MLTRRQQQQRKQAKEKEAAQIARLSKQLGRNPDGKATRTKRTQDNDLSVSYRQDVSPYKSLAGTKLDVPDVFAFEVDDYEEREKVAQEEIARKKLCTAPLYSKGPYQYVGAHEDPTTIGRKV